MPPGGASSPRLGATPPSTHTVTTRSDISCVHASRIRSAARKGDDGKAIDPETVEKVAHVDRPVTHAAVGVRLRVADAGTL